MTEIRVPTLGEFVTEATIGKWFKKPGDPIKVDEPLVELETDKVTIEVPAPTAGVLSEIVAKDGETVAVGALLGQITAGAGGAAAAPAAAKAAPAPAAPAPAAPAATPTPAAAKPASDIAPAPSVRKLSAESGVDFSSGCRQRQRRPRHQGRHARRDRTRCSRTDAGVSTGGGGSGASALAGG